MGAWGTGSFENDTACDWAYELEQTADLSLIVKTLASVCDADDDYLDADAACEGLAAAEAVARLKGNWGRRDSFTENVDKWVEEHLMPVSRELVELASAAIERILRSPSELLELWHESDDEREWRSSVAELKARIEAE